MATGSKRIIKIEITDGSGTVLSAEKNFIFPENLETYDDSIVIIKGRGIKQFKRGQKVDIIAYGRSGDRTKYRGTVNMSLDFQLNVSIDKYGSGAEVLEERRRYFKIKVSEEGRALYRIREGETVNFDEPVNILIQDINIGGIFISSPLAFREGDLVCIEADLFIDYTLKAVAEILRVQRDADGELLGYGCEFRELTASQEDYIGRYINKIQYEQRRNSAVKGLE